MNEIIEWLTPGLDTWRFGGFGGSGVQLGFEQSVPQTLQFTVQAAFTTSNDQQSKDDDNL